MDKDIITLKVIEICGSHCVGVEDGASLYNKILSIFQSKINKVSLDFTDILTITSSFLNASIGKLFWYLKEEDFNNRVDWKGLDDSDSQLLDLVIRNAKEHFEKPTNTKEVENSITKKILEEE